MAEIKQIEFSKLRHAYITVKSFIEHEAGDDLKSLKTKIEDDLGLAGDDNYDMLTKFVDKFKLAYADFEYDKHFYSEGELFGSSAALYNLLTLSIWLPLKTIEILTFNKIQIPKMSFHQPARQVSDMTFRDLLTWYIEGKYIHEGNVKYAIKHC
jgi:hypothetical protein